jgi:dihydroorotate dehydrogenase
MSIYAMVFRPLAFRLDPETAHHMALAAGARLGWAAGAMRTAMSVEDDRLATDVAGLHFPTPIGLAAGFDKSGSAVPALAGLGFGSIEIGSVSLDPSEGNPKPRLWRLPEDEGIVVHYGLPNDGIGVIAKRLARIRLPVPLGINLVVTNRGPGRRASESGSDHRRIRRCGPGDGPVRGLPDAEPVVPEHGGRP